MRITAHQFGKAIVLNVHEPLIGAEAGGLLQSTVQRQVLDGILMVILDLTHVKGIDAGGLRALTAAAGVMRLASGCFRLAGVNDRMSSQTVAWLVKTFPTFETVEDAVDDVRRGLEEAALRRAQASRRLGAWFRHFRRSRSPNPLGSA
jgi:anti-anti-sigma regulatory factor